ncbi:hypothetical protein RW270310_207 [Cyanophage S-RIM12]|uniref:PA14 domain-containing protein n=1 Tax=Cyanophage S-RIM12 TaxID=1278402 RepID=A0A1D7SVB8_9CAUD|nr:hypothetical protein RW270310_207 [Cyanophage S-RIM12]
MAYYYPEGYFGPICDAPATAEDIAFRRRPSPVEREDKDERVFVYPQDGITGEPWWTELDKTLGSIPTAIKSIKCKQTPDGSFYDCIYQYINDEFIPKQPLTPNELIGLKDNFTFPDFTPQTCSPFDPDINIKPRTFFLADGTPVVKNTKARSSPVTFDVNASSRYVVLDSGLSVEWNSTGTALVATGSGSSNVVLRLKWDDNPSTAGTAVDTITIVDSDNNSVTWTQSGEKGQEDNIVALTAGTYNLSYTGLNSANNPINVDGDTLKLKDGESDDTNASFKIQDNSNQEFGYNQHQWNEDGRNYGVWVNPEVCTLPDITQEVTYTIDIEQTGVYGFSFGSDNRGTLVLDGTDTLFNDVGAGIFDSSWATVNQSTPHTTTRTLQRGKILLTVACTNVANEVDGDGLPTGRSYKWKDNPGGWFIKICKGGACTSSNSISGWFPSGPDTRWSDFMNTYAVFPSVTDTLSGIPQSATWNISVPATDDYVLKLSADNSATITLDGSNVLTHSGFTTDSTTTLTGLTVGAHTIGATVTNGASASGVIDNWANNPAGVAWTITRPASSTTAAVTTTTNIPNDIDAEFNSDGDIVVTGNGSGQIQLIFEWDDNPNTNGTALGQLNIAGKNFTQTTGKERGSDSYKFTATAGQTYPITISDNPNGFRLRNNNSQLCFMDRDDDDCNAKLIISSVKSTGEVSSTTSENVTTVVDESVIASSLDLSTQTVDSSNLIWHTRLASGYEYY